MTRLFALALTGAAASSLLAQPITPYYLWELQPTHATLRAQPSATDLVNGFPETTTPGILSDQVINESFNNGLFGVIDPVNNVYSFLMQSATCLAIIPGLASNGFLPGFPGGRPGVFVDGVLNGPLDGILRDFGRAALAVRFGFSTPRDIGAIRVIGGNTNNRDGRTFQHYDVWASTDGLGDFGNFFLVAQGVKSGTFGMINNDQWSASLTEVHDFDSKYLVQGATDLRIVFYCVSNTMMRFQDQWQGNANEGIDYQTACPETEPEDGDGFRKAFEGAIIREVDVFPPGPATPWGDIDYNLRRDMLDFAAMQDCNGGSTTANGCFRFDLDENASVDAADLPGFAAIMTGPA